MVYEQIIIDAEIPGDLGVLRACQQLKNEVEPVIDALRSTIIYTIDDVYWDMTFHPKRDDHLDESLSSIQKQNVKRVRFIGNDANISRWAPGRALSTLRVKGIRPETIYLHYAYTPTASLANIFALVDTVDRLTKLSSRINHIKICNVPASLVVTIGHRLLNVQYSPNMDIVQLGNDLVVEFGRTGNQSVHVNLKAVPGNGTPRQDIVVDVTTLPLSADAAVSSSKLGQCDHMLDGSGSDWERHDW